MTKDLREFSRVIFSNDKVIKASLKIEIFSIYPLRIERVFYVFLYFSSMLKKEIYINNYSLLTVFTIFV